MPAAYIGDDVTYSREREREARDDGERQQYEQRPAFGR